MQDFLTGTDSGAVAAYRRADGRVGVRNHVLVLGVNGLVLRAAQDIAGRCLGAVCVATPTGRGHLGRDLELHNRQLIGMADNPNVAAVLVVGADAVATDEFAHAIAASGKPIATVNCDEADEDVLRVADLGQRRAAALVQAASRLRREPCALSDLIVGVECGHSDATSGVASNPVVGAAVDRLLDAGATVMMGETIEWLGAEHLLAKRCHSEALAHQIGKAVQARELMAQHNGLSLTGKNPGEENIRGGLTTIEEKALGAISKSGSRTIDGVIDFAQSPPAKGLYLMDGPSFSPESMTGFVAGGAQILLFTTGLGNGYASLLAPTVKISARPDTVRHLDHQIDFAADTVWRGEESHDACGARLVERIRALAEGELTWGEILGQGSEAITRTASTL